MNAVTPLEDFETLQNQLQSRLCGSIRDFEIAWQDQGLVLKGKAATYYAKQLAQHRVMTATSLPIVANDIEVASGR